MESKDAISGIREFNRFYTNIIGLLDKHILKSPYSLAEARILFEVNYRRECTARQIKDSLAMDEGYLSRIIDKFVRNRLVEKKRSATDGRAFFLSLTEKGREEFERINRASHDEIMAITRSLAPDQLQLLISQMKSIQMLLSKVYEQDHTR